MFRATRRLSSGAQKL